MRTTNEETSRSGAGRWLARGAFLLSTLALLGTSKPPAWNVEATITGPRTAPADRGLVVAIESSASTQLKVAVTGVADNPFNGGGLPCESPARCLLPPGGTLEKITLEGSCGGCSQPCAPPPGSFARATTSLVPVAKDTVVVRKDAVLPAHKPKWSASEVSVAFEGAELVEVDFHVAGMTGESIYDEKLACRDVRNPKRPICPFYIPDERLKKGRNFTITVTATGWSACSAEPCAPPKTLRVVSLDIGAK